ncbi:MAG: M23 family metallopeptidase [Thermoanaerobaculia bacterium]
MSAPRSEWLTRLALVAALAVIGWMAWRGAGPNGTDTSGESTALPGDATITKPVPHPTTAPPVKVSRTRPAAEVPFQSIKPAVPAPAAATAPPSSTAPLRARLKEALSEVSSISAPAPAAEQPSRALLIPVAGVKATALHDMFEERRGGGRKHEAIDILMPRGTPVIATEEGVVKKLFTSVPGGLTVYEFDREGRYCYYYAHLDSYASGLHEGQLLKRGELVGYVGTTGNAPKDTPHLHFAIFLLDADKRWWKGTPINPYPLLTAGRR